jgi:hypothetical protein
VLATAEKSPSEGLNGQSFSPRNDREARYARAIRIRESILERERRAKARLFEQRERVHRAGQLELLDEIMTDGVTLGRLRAAAQKLEALLEWRAS